MSKICVVGDYDSICGFNALGIETFVADDEVGKMISNITNDDYAIILITENVAVRITDILDKYKSKPIPALITIPSVTGSERLGMRYLRNAVEQAVGSADMIFGTDDI